jgi:hypothetical protein
VNLELVSVDSTVARAHQHAAGMVVNPELLRQLDEAVAKEKGFTKGAKRHNSPGRVLDDQPRRGGRA